MTSHDPVWSKDHHSIGGDPIGSGSGTGTRQGRVSVTHSISFSFEFSRGYDVIVDKIESPSPMRRESLSLGPSIKYVR